MNSVARKIVGQSRPQLRFVNLWSASPRTSLLRRSYATAKLDLPALDQKWRRPIPKLGESPNLPENSKSKFQTVKDRMYILSMFPYPSGNLHLGHLRVYTIADVIARFHRLRGHDVLLPMGWDAFGLPAENAAIERGIDPAIWTKDNIARMKEQLECMNGSFDWSREFATCDPEFYKHTQKIFLLLHKHGLVSQKKATVNWDPIDMTVLANEQVDSDGRSWRSGAKIVQRELQQWFFHITKFQESLLEDLNKLSVDEAWPERVLAMQKNWLGRTEGAYYDFAYEEDGKTEKHWLKIYTTRPETIYAAQFIALSPQSPIVERLAQSDSKLREFVERVKDLPPETAEAYRVSQLKAISPLELGTGNSEQSVSPLPVFVTPYVRGDYETGAIMGVPAHDARDFAFWKRHCSETSLKYAVSPEPDGSTESLKNGPYLESGYCTPLTGSYAKIPSGDAARQIVDRINDQSGLARHSTKWKIRDWLISRQRYWGTPIPIIHCSTCGPQPVPDDQLPVVLPKVDAHWEDGRTGNPLETATEWVNTSCPKCHGLAKRDTDTMDTFVDSSWYYMRFPDPYNSEAPISADLAKSYLPVDIYIGGVEHAILHLLYARFIYKAVVDLLGLPVDPSKEPFKKLITQGMVHGKTYSDPDTGRFLKPNEVDLSSPSEPKIVASGKTATISFEKMSKSKHNGVDPTTFIAQYGSDATRAHILFQAPVGEVLNWDEDKIQGVIRWLRRFYDFIQKIPIPTDGSIPQFDSASYFQSSNPAEKKTPQYLEDAEIWRATQNTIISVTSAIEKVYSMNTTVSSLMELTNLLVKNKKASDVIKREASLMIIRMMAPITPAFAEECWSILNPGRGSVFNDSWPVTDNSLALLDFQDRITSIVQVNGRIRCVVDIPRKPESLKDGTPEFHEWIKDKILQSEDARQRLVGDNDITKATKVYVVKGGATVNYVIPKQKE
ncbi:leucyl-tRNA synthetase [Rostrohypoxylon terebratum]|nr:leucyl-tRNA synthetase [Rostrohypoxylon terebratum]